MDAVLKKLRYNGQDPVLVAGVPEESMMLVDSLKQAGAQTTHTTPKGAYPWAIVFVKSLAEAREVARDADALVEGDGVLWLAYPKGTSKRYEVDINRDSAWPLFDDSAVRFVANVAIDDDWSAIRLRRKEFVKS